MRLIKPFFLVQTVCSPHDLKVFPRNFLNQTLTSRTVDPTAQERGFPPNVLKCSALVRVWEISLVVTTAARGKPFPIPFAMVTEKVSEMCIPLAFFQIEALILIFFGSVATWFCFCSHGTMDIGYKSWYGWAYSNSSVQLIFRKKELSCFGQI